jgi:hypothetical protein
MMKYLEILLFFGGMGVMVIAVMAIMAVIVRESWGRLCL